VRARFFGDRGDHAEHAIGVDFLRVCGHLGLGGECTLAAR
jgi:hypothetical protein